MMTATTAAETTSTTSTSTPRTVKPLIPINQLAINTVKPKPSQRQQTHYHANKKRISCAKQLENERQRRADRARIEAYIAAQKEQGAKDKEEKETE